MSGHGMFDLSGKVALITGSSSGLGRAYAEAMAEYGADVACNGRDEAALSETLKILKKYGRRTIAIKADVTRSSEIQRMVHLTVKELGGIDIFFNNAGIARPRMKIHEISIEDWDAVINTNLRAMFLGLKYVLPVMIKNKSGSIINTSSIAGLRAEVPEVAPASYGASKAAVINLTQVAAMEYAADGIRVNCIAPGMHKSNLGRPRNAQEGPTPIEMKGIEQYMTDYCAAEIPMGRIAQASELKGLAVLLASSASSYITGQVFVEDGGQSARL
jgi:NAD(P)-dependent dehydrogenase (short-subunit alcohol dehydrogenase family)